ncbi:PHP domain-containing protein [Alkalihalobacterium bogoriense]|uniref:PHP domain-containing protein n=1 Tax=Alkalihalobacterium bogoriense TaxID=246272 RepID=UPI00047E9548|nr:PHP domain-containing protein [Alkalihalobacterium bogoriense]
MNIDFHTHGKLSKKAEFTLEGFQEHIQMAKENRLDAIALTEHFNTTNFEVIYDTLDQHYPYIEDYYVVEGVKVFPGIEVDISEVGHILLIGTRADILDINEKLSAHRLKENFISFASLLELADQYELLKIGAHPFRESKKLSHLPKEQLMQLDALDLNATDLYHQGLKMKDELFQYAYSLELPVVAGSDTHQCLQFGSIYNEFKEEANTIAELKQVIARKKYDIEISPCLQVKVQGARMLKKKMKAVMAV